MLESLSAYWQYLKYPRLLVLSKNKKMLWKDLLWLLVLDIAFATLIGVIYYSLLHFRLIRKYEEVDIFKYGFRLAMFLGVVFAPVAEEVLFRWQLRKPKWSILFVLISIVVTAWTVVKNDYALFFIGLGLLVIGLVAVMVIDKLDRLRKVKVFRTYYVFLFYYTAILFGYIHITNAKGLTLADPSFIFYIGSQIFGGLSMGYLRVKYGLKYGILLHAAFNFIAVPIAWLLA
ncbi:type II CAAX prenyl endopeptidase Rce1 family protein [Pedobacter foliorum]|uniref:CPBP family glutamic-type intramembrane protease n=1 Tax=Pedobacter foliorum TaxID=2739058 RepID=UPI0015657342|nr:CPBP family glutamic-type intramembrane protease [Pedobacter foliorum]NRF37629.1 CPBP family intramembrane metalloprotease [Pedobacter foliorum]